MRTPVYLDYAATTPVDPEVAAAMAECLTADGAFGNPASSHAPGREARARVEAARAALGELLGCAPENLVFTSGATEADNLAIRGVAEAATGPGRHIITSRIEHKAVLDPCRALERQGFDVTWLVPGADGRIHPEQLREALRDDTALVSLMHVNNETGVINDIAAIGAALADHAALFHVDAAQSVGKIPLDLSRLPVDLLSLSGHKFYGPKGVGALYVRPGLRNRLVPQMLGGGHERGLRSGTLATHQLVGLGKAAELARQALPAEAERIAGLRRRLWEALGEEGELNGDPEARVPGILNLSFPGVEGESLLLALSDLAVSSGAACTSASREPSYVLRALGRDDQLAQSSLRFSLGRFSTAAEVDFATARVKQELARLRELAPPAASAKNSR